MRQSFSELFAIDTRTLALFRIALAALVFFDLADRSTSLAFDYTDAGAVPTSTRGVFGPALTIHWWSGAWAYQAGLLAVHALAALALGLGFRTRAAAALCWLLTTSLHFRNPLIGDAGDAVARMLLLWSIFLPLGARASLDALRAGRGAEPPARVASVATAAVMLQVVLLYFVAGVTKSGPEWIEGTAVAAALDNHYWTRPLGERLLDHPSLLETLTFGSRALEVFGPLLLFVPVWTAAVRSAVLLAFWGFQLGLATTIELHLFPLFSSCATLVFVPASWWGRIRPGAAQRGADAGREEPVPMAPRSARDRIAGGVVGALLVANLALAADCLGWLRIPLAADAAARSLGLFQCWSLYAPRPPEFDRHFRILGVVADGGGRVELVASDGATAATGDPGGAWRDVVSHHASYRFKYALERLMRPDSAVEPWRRTYLDWMCRSWNATHPDRPLERVVFTATARPTRTVRRGTPIRPEIVAQIPCPPPSQPSLP